MRPTGTHEYDSELLTLYVIWFGRARDGRDRGAAADDALLEAGFKRDRVLEGAAGRAAHLLADSARIRAGVHLHLTKGVPTAGGMGGGSADAAAALLACDLLWDTGLARDELADVVRRLEAGGTTLEESLALWERGEELAKICQAWLDDARTRLDAARAPKEPGAVDADEDPLA